MIRSDNVKIELNLDSTSLLGIEGLGTKGGSELDDNTQEKLIESVIAKSPESSTSQISINKFLEKIWYLVKPVATDSKVWRVLSEFEKPYEFTMIQPTNQLTSSNRPNDFENVIDDFESRLTKQKVLNQHESKLQNVQVSI